RDGADTTRPSRSSSERDRPARGPHPLHLVDRELGALAESPEVDEPVLALEDPAANLRREVLGPDPVSEDRQGRHPHELIIDAPEGREPSRATKCVGSLEPRAKGLGFPRPWPERGAVDAAVECLVDERPGVELVVA